jgi:hypothetical protein
MREMLATQTSRLPRTIEPFYAQTGALFNPMTPPSRR